MSPTTSVNHNLSYLLFGLATAGIGAGSYEFAKANQDFSKANEQISLYKKEAGKLAADVLGKDPDSMERFLRSSIAAEGAFDGRMIALDNEMRSGLEILGSLAVGAVGIFLRQKEKRLAQLEQQLGTTEVPAK